MENKKDFNKWRAEKLGYVYFSRFADLIISEPNFKEPLFDYLIDIGENDRQMGRFFGVEVESYDNKIQQSGNVGEYKNVSIPSLLVMFDNTNDQGYYKWIKKPVEKGRLLLDTAKNNGIEELNNIAIKEIVTQVKDWYSGHEMA